MPRPFPSLVRRWIFSFCVPRRLQALRHAAASDGLAGRPAACPVAERGEQRYAALRGTGSEAAEVRGTRPGDRPRRRGTAGSGSLYRTTEANISRRTDTEGPRNNPPAGKKSDARHVVKVDV